MRKDGYNHFCPVAKACEVLEPRWTLLVLCELWAGSSHFNEIRRGVPGMSPTLLSKRLKDMERLGLVTRATNPATREIAYRTTPFADEIEPLVHALGVWAHRNIDSEVSLEHLDARLLMWNMRRKINAESLPAGRRSVVQFVYPELPEEERHYWLVGAPGRPVDLCLTDPEHDVDLYVTADLHAMTAAWMGHSTIRAEVARGRIELAGDRALIATMSGWMVRSSYAVA